MLDLVETLEHSVREGGVFTLIGQGPSSDGKADTVMVLRSTKNACSREAFREAIIASSPGDGSFRWREDPELNKDGLLVATALHANDKQRVMLHFFVPRPRRRSLPDD